MSRLNNDLEAGLGSSQNIQREDQAYLLDSQNGEAQENTVEDLRNTFEYSTVYNFIALSLPTAKIFASLIVLITGNYPCIGTKQVWLLCMLVHDALHALIIFLRLNIIFSISRLDSMPGQNENGSNNIDDSQAPIHQEIQLSERPGALLPQNQQEEEVSSPNRSNRAAAIAAEHERANQARQILVKKDRVGKLTTLCTYVWMFLFLFWLEMDAIHINGTCDTKQINSLIYVFVIIGWIWLLNPLIICIMGCLCLPVLVLIMLIFRKPQQTPATQAEINNLPVKQYNSEIPGNKECAICMSDYVEGERILQLECSPLHHFHEQCLKDWLKINGQCPTCRARIGNRMEPPGNSQ